jgi:hypothetical protein
LEVQQRRPRRLEDRRLAAADLGMEVSRCPELRVAVPCCSMPFAARACLSVVCMTSSLIFAKSVRTNARAQEDMPDAAALVHDDQSCPFQPRPVDRTCLEECSSKPYAPQEPSQIHDLNDRVRDPHGKGKQDQLLSPMKAVGTAPLELRTRLRPKATVIAVSVLAVLIVSDPPRPACFDDTLGFPGEGPAPTLTLTSVKVTAWASFASAYEHHNNL